LTGIETDTHQIATDWITFQLLPKLENAPDDVFDRGWALYDLAFHQPDLAWVAILSVIDRYDAGDLFGTDDTEAKSILGSTAAGPLEDLLAYHGIDFIEKIETKARQDRRMFWTLGCVWQNAMPDEIWERVQRAAGGISR
jgi:hypothetical protein